MPSPSPRPLLEVPRFPGSSPACLQQPRAGARLDIDAAELRRMCDRLGLSGSAYPEEDLRRRFLEGWALVDPFGGPPPSPRTAIELFASWRRLFSANRQIASIQGIARWKRAALAPLLWDGRRDVPFDQPLAPGGTTAIWRARTSTRALRAIDASGGQRLEIEDGFIRSAGLGADCVPPLSIVVERDFAHYDPSGPSGVERLVAKGGFDGDLLARAARLRTRIVSLGIGKYGASSMRFARPGGARRHLLVIGQVADDLSLRLGGAGLDNMALLRRVRLAAPDAFILYRPHPDVTAGHRAGHVPDGEALAFADMVAREPPIAALIEAADEVHAITSLAGFEALLRGKRVVTHGVPFYAGWGLTTDLGPVPARRMARRSIDELVAAALLLHPRYLDPLTRLPCPVEVAVERVAGGAGMGSELLVGLRRRWGSVRRAARWN
ncbi:Capsule polysaccharide biosynthesis [Novosphingobium aromaticivorans DSM 12444]|uniref:Capsule polysaccharide biosynthesis n=1 Tax=Novosphingobium aromaticivorans (strain ATCC 700278 / DSM 12444 / CCUG 56034 / CIP 105152 / NBRC 16084 / F199) TaxID=279238 RepID=Q2G8U3_NOVAD|nr:capsule polysaccharide biosynthesis [Novosphingobium aromaticivorans]ABD25730.1 Capsule polysaccharide biosynthesis [Novosphingobium aromaticivorans DSM 12444]SCY01865.1 capsular polysaccharide export protein [Novosphingobium aromaticivorans]